MATSDDQLEHVARSAVRCMQQEARLLERLIQGPPKGMSRALIDSMAEAADRLNDAAQLLARELDRPTSNPGLIRRMLTTSGVVVALATGVLTGVSGAVATNLLDDDGMQDAYIELSNLHAGTVQALAECDVQVGNVEVWPDAQPPSNSSIAPDEGLSTGFPGDDWRRGPASHSLSRALGRELFTLLEGANDAWGGQGYPRVTQAKAMFGPDWKPENGVFVQLTIDGEASYEINVENETLPADPGDSLLLNQRLLVLADEGLSNEIDDRFEN